MSDIIHLLPDSVANQIAAGEVIQRPASVIKELVENAIDAGATHIRVVIKDAGRTLIQVTDDGKGMSETDGRMAFERHATSKIKNADDLFALRTMGFRGEALASIAAVAQVELRTRRDDDELGVLIEIAGTKIFRHELVQCDKGSTFMVKNLFFNVPARRRFLKSDNVEKSHILNEFYRIVLVNNEIEFSFFDGEEEMFHLPASNVKARIENVLGKNQKKRIQQQLLPIETSTNLVKIYGYVGKPEFAQKSPNQYFFVNGRYMRHPYFHKAVIMAYSQMIQANEGPNYFIYFDVEPDTIDINIHPTKTEIKFENEQAIWSILSAAVKEALGKFNIVPSIDFDQDGAIDIPASHQLLPEDIKPPRTNFNPEYNPFTVGGSSYKRPALDWEKLYNDFETSPAKPDAVDFDTEESPEVVPVEEELVYTQEFEQQSITDTGDAQSVNFQFKNRYIVTSVKSGMLIIDQNRAHERILYEAFLGQIKTHHANSQQLLFPELIELNDDNALYFDQIAPDLQSAGFVFNISEGGNQVEVVGTPAELPAEKVVGLIDGLIEKARTTGMSSSESIHELVASSLARGASLKSGKSMTDEEMSDIIDRLFACDSPNFTPDGKPVMSIFSLDEIQSRFR
ncbi:MAG: mismatch repair protein MutL [Bacteroidetes bacterium]|nr:mismatch repair protein MutL [Bacteroidota bacterium]